jgi:hypothetical protein
MNERLSNWLKKEILPRRKRAAPSSTARQIARLFRLFVLLLLCLFLCWRLLLWHDVNRQFDRIRAAGYPVSGAELNAWQPPVPDPENGALVLTQAFALVRNFPDARSNEVAKLKNPARTNVWTPTTHELVAAYVQTNAPALARVREALLLSRFRYPVDFSYGPETPLPHLTKLREMAGIAALAAALDAEEGRADQWPDQVELQLKLAGTLDGEPCLISHLVRNRIIGMAVRATERSLNNASPGAEACQRLQAAFARASQTNSLPLALAGERAKMIPLFRMSWQEIQSDSEDEGQESKPHEPHRYSGKPWFPLWLTGYFERDLNFFLQYWDKSISLSALPPPANLTLTNYLESAVAAAQRRWDLMSGFYLLGLSKVIVSEASTQAGMRLATTALAIERFRRERGRLPGELKELTPQFLDAVPTDPFDGAPLRYRLLDRGYIIYSVDADGHDDGGREPPEIKKSSDTNSYDITFIVEH